MNLDLENELWYLFQECRAKERHTSECRCMSGEGRILKSFIGKAIIKSIKHAFEETAVEEKEVSTEQIEKIGWMEATLRAHGYNKALSIKKEKEENYLKRLEEENK